MSSYSFNIYFPPHFKDLSLFFCRVSSREDRAPSQHARQLLGQDHTHHGGYVHCCHTFPSHREYCELAFMYRLFLIYLFYPLAFSLSPPSYLAQEALVDQCLLGAGLVSRWTHANLKLIYIKCWNGAFDVWRLHITHLHILGLCSAHPSSTAFLHPVGFVIA